MSVELKQAAQDAAEAIDWLLKNIRLDAPQLSGKAMGNAEKCASALRTALYQPPDNAACKSVQKRLEAQQPVTGEPPIEAIGRVMNWAMEQAVANGANSVSMPDEIVEIAAWLAGIPPQPAQATQVEVTDDLLHDIADDFKSQYTHGGQTFDEFAYIPFARAILALSPERVPMTDEQIRSMCKQGWVFETVRQWVNVIEAHHDITAQAKKEGE